MEKNGLLQKLSLQKSTFTPYEDDHDISPLKMFIIVVHYGQSKAILNILNEIDTAVSLTLQASGGSFDSGDLFGTGEHKKEMVITLVRSDKSELLTRLVNERFKVSRASRGILYSVSLTSVVGVTMYKFLTNTRKGKKVSKNGKKR